MNTENMVKVSFPTHEEARNMSTIPDYTISIGPDESSTYIWVGGEVSEDCVFYGGDRGLWLAIEQVKEMKFYAENFKS